MEAEQLGRLRDILEAAELIASYVAGTTETAFRADRQKQDAVIRRIEIIGEATAPLSEATRQAIPELPFRRMRGMRNLVAHEYANVDLTIVWSVDTAGAGGYHDPRGVLRSVPLMRGQRPTARLPGLP